MEKNIKNEEKAHKIIFSGSEDTMKDYSMISGVDFEQDLTLDMFISQMSNIGIQASKIKDAINEIKKMILWNGENNEKCTIFLGFTSNMITSGIRDIIRFLIKNKYVNCVVTTAGGVEEDLMKCLAPTYLGDFSMSGKEMRSKGLNRAGNMIIPNNNYCKFEDWINPLLNEMFNIQNETNLIWTPSKVIKFLGEKINNETSFCYWAYKNDIPVFCPAITDGSLGDLLYFFSSQNKNLIIDVVEDVKLINKLSIKSSCTGMIILGGSVVKHHICNANLMRNGADFSVFINNASPMDASDSGADPDEAVSWGKIKSTAHPVKVYCDASIAFPLIIAGSFYPFHRTIIKSKDQTSI